MRWFPFLLVAACVPDVPVKPICSASQPCEDAAAPTSTSSSSSSSGDLEPTQGDAGVIIPRCGDGVAQTGEDCDGTDGCSAQCKLVSGTPDSTATCPGLDVHVWPHTQPTFTSTTVGSGHRTSNTCAINGNVASDGSKSADRIFKVTAHATGTLSVVTTDVNYNCYIYSAESCSDPNVQSTSCVNKVDGIGAETLKLSVSDGLTYTVVIDGASLSGGTDTSEGAFTVTFSID